MLDQEARDRLALFVENEEAVMDQGNVVRLAARTCPDGFAALVVSNGLVGAQSVNRPKHGASPRMGAGNAS